MSAVSVNLRLHLRAFSAKRRVVTLPLPYVPAETPTKVGVLNRQRCNYPNVKPAKYCGSCMQPGMVNVNDPRCRCSKSQPIYNFPNETKPVCCHDCKEPTMVNVKERRKCACGAKRPIFHYPGERKNEKSRNRDPTRRVNAK